MADLALQEQELVDLLKKYGECSDAELHGALNWGTAKLSVTLARLVKLGVVESRSLEGYRRTRYHKLVAK